MKVSTLQRKTKAELIDMLLTFEKKLSDTEQQLSDLTIKLQQSELSNRDEVVSAEPITELTDKLETESNEVSEDLSVESDVKSETLISALSIISEEQKEALKEEFRAELEDEFRTQLLTQPDGEPTCLNLALQTGIQVLPTVQNFMNGALVVRTNDGGKVRELRFTDAVRHLASFLYNESPDAFEFRNN